MRLGGVADAVRSSIARPIPGRGPGRVAAGLLLAMVAPVFADGSGVPTAAAEPVSAVQVPVDLDLSPWFSAAESALPTQAGHWPGWRDWHGISARYRAWRGPLALSMQGDVIQAQAHVRYQIQARKGLVAGLKLSAGCGVDEPPRQALIGLMARIQWGPDWTLHPAFRVLPTRFIDRCEVTAAGIDVSPLVGNVFEERIELSVRKAMDALAPKLEGLRDQAARAWVAAQSPRELTPGLWLRIEPLSIALAPPQGLGNRMQTAVWLAFRASLSGEPGQAQTAPRPLPPLLPFVPSEPGLRLSLGLKLDYPGVSAALGGRLVGQTFDVQEKKARIDSVALAANGEDLVLTLGLGADLAGRLRVMARPGFDPTAQALRLEQVDFVYDAKAPDLGLAANLFYDRIRERIEATANALLAERTAGLRDAIGALLRQSLPKTMNPDLKGLRFADLKIGVGETGLTLHGTAEGALALTASAAP